jgi:hypothetical protein
MDKSQLYNVLNDINDNLDYAQIFFSYLKWIIDNIEETDENMKLLIDQLNIINQCFSYPEQKLYLLKKKLDELYSNFNFNKNEIDIQNFIQIDDRILNKLKK